MSMTDPIADMLTRIRNANQMRNEIVKMPHSKTKVEIARILKEEGFINDYIIEESEKKVLTLILKLYIIYFKQGSKHFMCFNLFCKLFIECLNIVALCYF